jgi:hypothetical protein
MEKAKVTASDQVGAVYSPNLYFLIEWQGEGPREQGIGVPYLTLPQVTLVS